MPLQATTIRLDGDDLDLITSVAKGEGVTAAQWIARRAVDEALRHRIAGWINTHRNQVDDPELGRWDTYQQKAMNELLAEDTTDAA